MSPGRGGKQRDDAREARFDDPIVCDTLDVMTSATDARALACVARKIRVLHALSLFAMSRRNLAVHRARESECPRSWPPPPIPGAGGCKDKEAKKAAVATEGISRGRSGDQAEGDGGEGDVGRRKKKGRNEAREGRTIESRSEGKEG